jgi:hypothetical protein
VAVAREQAKPVDVNRVILGGQLVAIVALLVARSYLKIVARRTGAA